MHTVEDLSEFHRAIARKGTSRFGQSRERSQSSGKAGEGMTGVAPLPPFKGPAPGKKEKADKRPR